MSNNPIGRINLVGMYLMCLAVVSGLVFAIIHHPVADFEMLVLALLCVADLALLVNVLTGRSPLSVFSRKNATPTDGSPGIIKSALVYIIGLLFLWSAYHLLYR